MVYCHPSGHLPELGGTLGGTEAIEQPGAEIGKNPQAVGCTTLANTSHSQPQVRSKVMVHVTTKQTPDLIWVQVP